MKKEPFVFYQTAIPDPVLAFVNKKQNCNTLYKEHPFPIVNV